MEVIASIIANALDRATAVIMLICIAFCVLVLIVSKQMLPLLVISIFAAMNFVPKWWAKIPFAVVLLFEAVVTNGYLGFGIGIAFLIYAADIAANMIAAMMLQR